MFLHQEEGGKVSGFSGHLTSPTPLDNNRLATATGQQQDKGVFVPAQEHAERQVWSGATRKQVCGARDDGDDEEELPSDTTVPSNQAYVVIDS